MGEKSLVLYHRMLSEMAWWRLEKGGWRRMICGRVEELVTMEMEGVGGGVNVVWASENFGHTAQ